MNTLKLRIEQDLNATSPAENDDCVYLIADHRSCFIPPPGKGRSFDVQDEIDSAADTHHVFLLEAYIHSGVRLALAGEGKFPDRQWDVSLLGAVFVPKEDWSLRDSAREVALAKVEEWNQYLSGDVWGYIIEDEQGNHLDSCWGFYGQDYAKQEGQQMLKYCQEHSLSEANQI